MSDIQAQPSPNLDIASHEIKGTSTWAVQVREQIRRAAQRNANVLILGTTGTGKDLIARAVHQQSNRAAQPFVVVDCSSASGECFAEQLFGRASSYHAPGENGQNSDQHFEATDAMGAFRAAEGGTIFFDEVGDLDAACQARLLRSIEQRTIIPLGGHDAIAVDVRILASSNRNLAGDVAAGRFRPDLYYRLRVITIEAAPLRARPEDILILANHFLREIAASENEPPHTLAAAAEAKLLAQTWPGNVRELRNTIERAVAFADSPTIDAELISDRDVATISFQERLMESDDRLLPRQILPFSNTNEGASSLQATALPLPATEMEAGVIRSTAFRMLTAAENERIQILTAMQMANHNQSHAATLLGVTRQQLRRRIAKHFPDSMPAKRGRPRLPKAA